MIDEQQFLRKDKKKKKFFLFCAEKPHPLTIRNLCNITKFSVERFGK